jgi:NAD(P)-dependent dehydrogenase (short-subunit alcohol dehydrogenase family)
MSEKRNLLILGGTGTVGRGIARRMSTAGWAITAVARDGDRLRALSENIPGVTTEVGSVASDAEAADLAARLGSSARRFDAIVAAFNVPPFSLPLLDCPGDRLVEVLQGNLVSHLCAARAILPLLVPGGRYVGIGGGMADFTVPGLGAVSICQAGQRNLYRFLAQEAEAKGVSVVELMLYSHIVDPADEPSASPRDIRADEVGDHVRAVIEQPEMFSGPILALKSRKQVGLPQREDAASA